MTANLTADRHDIVFLRRRLKPGEAVTASSPTRTSSLRLGGSEARTEPPRPVLDIPVLSGRMELTSESPVVRLNQRQSAVGSFTVDNVAGFGFTVAGVSGVQSSSQTSHVDMPVYGNRPLASFENHQLVVGLRHFGKLKRLVMWASSGRVSVKFLNGSEIIVDSADGVNGLYVHRVKNVLEFRLETVHSKDFVQEFSVVE